MRASLAVLVVAGAGCATGPVETRGDDPVSHRFAELAPRRICVAIAGEEPADAQARIDRFGLVYPKAIGPDTVLPPESETTRRVSAELSEGLTDFLRARGYEVAEIDGAGSRVGDLLRPETCDAVFVVHYRAATRWPISEYRGTTTHTVAESETEAVEVRQKGRTFAYDVEGRRPVPVREESRQFVFMIERGLLLLPTAHLIDTRTSLRLWSRSNHGLEDDRVEMASPLRKMGVVVPIEREPPPFEQLVPQAVRALVPYYFESVPAFDGRVSRPRLGREADLREEAAVQRFRDPGRWVVDVGSGYRRRTLDADAGPVEFGGDDAFGGAWHAEAGFRQLGRRILHGGRAAFSRDTADYHRRVFDTSGDGPAFTDVTLTSQTAVDLAYTVAWTWQPRRHALLAAGAGPALGVVLLDGEGLDHTKRLLAGAAAEIEGHFVHDWLLVGPFVRGTWQYDLSESGASLALALGLRAGVTF